MEKERFEFWMNVSQWTLHELAFLLLGREPEELADIKDVSVREEMKRELEKWEAWSSDCPGINNWDMMHPQPSTLRRPIDNNVELHARLHHFCIFV